MEVFLWDTVKIARNWMLKYQVIRHYNVLKKSNNNLALTNNFDRKETNFDSICGILEPVDALK
jgi:hypothetical protein